MQKNVFLTIVLSTLLLLPAVAQPLQQRFAAEAQSSVTTPSGLRYEILVPGEGEVATVGSRVKVHYVGTFEDGSKFDSSRDRNQPFEFQLGQRRVIAGWEEGVQGMKVGETRKLFIPYALAYGANGRPPVIPPKSNLVFEVELLGVEGN